MSGSFSVIGPSLWNHLPPSARAYFLSSNLSTSLGAIHLWCPWKTEFLIPPTPLSTCVDMKHIALLKRLVQWPSGPKAEIRLCDCNLFKTVLLIISITNLYRRKMLTFYSILRRNSGKKTLTSLREKKTIWHQWTLILIFCVDVHIGLDPSPSVHMRPPEPDPLLPLCGHHKLMAPYHFLKLAVEGHYINTWRQYNTIKR